MKIKSEVIYYDDDIMVVNKAPGIATVGDRFDSQLPYLLKWLNQKYGQTFAVHRLDTNTSGLICFARTTEEQKRLSQAFENREVIKKYKAIVLGNPQPSQGIIEASIFKEENKNLVIISAKGKKAITHYSVEVSFPGFSVLDLLIETGRTHQIRVHLQHIGHPLLVDPDYGGKELFMLSSVKSNFRGDREDEKPLLYRTPLHAYQLTIPLKEGGEKTFESALPRDMQAVIKQLSKLKRIHRV